MGLSFLNKKIWHPGSFANMEKTWVTEQRYREVEIRAIEKAKKIKEEKVIEEMKKIQVDKGLIPASQLNRLDFMYQCPDPEATQKSTPNEDFLLGKRLDDNTDNIFMKNKIQKKNIVPMFADNYANPKNEDFVRIHEDPLYLILKEEQKQRKEIEQNPYKMKMILNDNTWRIFSGLRGCSGFAGNTSKPMPLPSDEVKRLFGSENSKQKVVVPYSVGDNVQIIDGPLGGHVG